MTDVPPDLHDAHVKAWRKRPPPRAPFLRFGPYSDGTFEEVDLLAAVLQTDSQKQRLLLLEAQRLAEEEEQRRDASAKGVGKRLKKLAKKRTGFDDKVKACQERGEDTSKQIKRWAGEHRVTDDTIRNWLKELAPK